MANTRETLLPPKQEEVNTTSSKITITTNGGMYGDGTGNTSTHFYGGTIDKPKKG